MRGEAAAIGRASTNGSCARTVMGRCLAAIGDFVFKHGGRRGGTARQLFLLAAAFFAGLASAFSPLAAAFFGLAASLSPASALAAVFFGLALAFAVAPWS